MKLTKSAQNTVLRLWIELTKSVTYIYGKAKLTRFEEIFEEYYIILFLDSMVRKFPSRMRCHSPLLSRDDLKLDQVENQHW